MQREPEHAIIEPGDLHGQFRRFHANVTRYATGFEDMVVTPLSGALPAEFDVALGRTRVRLSVSAPAGRPHDAVLACHRLPADGAKAPLHVASTTISPGQGELGLCDHRQRALQLVWPGTVRHVLTPWLLVAMGLN